MDDAIQALIASAKEAARNAYIPYSHYPVGAALRASDGTIFSGCNVENAAYPSGLCAERVALVKAVSEGHRVFETLAVVTPNGGSPCGSCRQMLYEFSPEMRVILARGDGMIVYDGTLSDLLPRGFGPDSLPHESS